MDIRKFFAKKSSLDGPPAPTPSAAPLVTPSQPVPPSVPVPEPTLPAPGPPSDSSSSPPGLHAEGRTEPVLGSSAKSGISSTATAPPCPSSCCSSAHPYQPTDAATLSKTARTQGERTRSFCAEWYDQYGWLSLCSESGKVFCHVCRKQDKLGKLTMSKHKEPAFVEHGYNNWKKAQEYFKKHERSMCHQDACTKELHEKQEDISALLSQQASMEHSRRRTCLKKVLETLVYLLRQNIPIRGKQEAEGNLSQLLLVRKKDVPDLQNWNDYLSPVIQNELIRSIGTTLLRNLLKDIREAKFFAILADEATDVSLKQQVSLSIRWVDDDLQIQEDPVELIHTEATTGEVLAATLKDALVRMELPLSQCRGQAYDGAANMQGRVKGVASRIIEECPPALHVHCLAHCTNLALQEAARKNKMIRSALDITNELTSFVRNSPKTAAALKRVTLAAESVSGSLRPLCPTRWTCRTASLRSVVENYEHVMVTLEEVSSETSGEHARKAGGMLALMEKFDTLIGLHSAIEVFSLAEDLSRGLQSATATVGETQEAVHRVCERYKGMRGSDSFDKLFEKAERHAEEAGVEGPKLPRKRKVPMRLDGGGEFHDSTVKDLYRRQFYEVLDTLTGQLKERFLQPTFEKVRAVERLLEDAGAGRDFSVPSVVKDLYSSDIDLARLEVQLKMLPDVVGDGRKKVHMVLQALVEAKKSGGAVFAKMMSEVLTLAKLYLTIPVTTATAERSFSCLRRIKSYLRSTMGQVRLNAAMLCTVHRQRVDELDTNVIAAEFFAGNDRRRAFFGV